MKNFDLSFLELESFVAVCTYRNFTKAAEKLFISQPTLSRRIKAIEEELGVSLFHRNGTYIELNEAGRFLFKEASKILQQKENIYASMSRFSDNVAGTLRIAVVPAFPLDVVMYGIEEMARQYPDVSVRVEYFHKINIPKYLQEQTVDIGFTFRGFVEGLPDLHFRSLGSNHVILMVGRTHRLFDREEVTWQDLDREILYVTNAPSKFMNEAYKLGVRFADIVITRSFEEAAMYAASGKGVAITGTDSAGVFSGSRHLRAIPLADSEYPLGQLVFAWAESNDNPLIQKFCELYDSLDLEAERHRYLK